jgi:hypothetical protein
VTYTLIYPDYINLATGKTLVATPGSAYTVAIASGRNAASSAFPNDGRWSNTSTFVAMEFLTPPESATLKTVGPVAAAAVVPDSDKLKEGA